MMKTLYSILLSLLVLLSSTSAISSDLRFQPQYFYPPNTTMYWKDDFIPGSFASGCTGEHCYVSSGAITVATSIVNHPGLITLDTGAVINTNAFMIPGAGASNGDFMSAEKYTLLFILRYNNNDVDTTQRFGAQVVGNGNPGTDGVYIEKLGADTQWFCVARAASVQTRVVIASSDTSFHTFRIRKIDASTVGCQIDGATEVTVSSNVPTTSALRQFVQMVNLAAASKTLTIDFMSNLITGMTR